MRVLNGLAPFVGAVLCASCASQELARGAPTPDSAPFSSYRSASSDRTLERHTDAIADALGAERGRHHLRRTQVERAKIGTTGSMRTANHELAFPGADPEKILNQTLADSDSLGALSITDAGGGWAENDEDYRHSPSGMVCTKLLLMPVQEGEDTSAFVVLPVTAINVYDQIGHDTSCHYENKQAGIFLTFYASRWPDVSLADHFAAALNDMTKQMPIDTGSMVISANSKADDDDVPSSIEGDTEAAGFILKPIKGVTYKSVLWLNKTGEWHVKARATFALREDPKDNPFSITELFAAIAYSQKLDEVDQHINSGNLVQVRHNAR